MLFLYRFLINIIIIFSPLIIIFRLIKKKEHLTRFKEKLCFFSKKRGSGNLVWFHGSSVGEILSIIPVIENLEKDKSINKILLTSSTLSSSNILKKFKFKKTIHQFFPIDGNYFCKKFLNYWKPKAVFFVESEIWPNFLINIKKKNIPLILLNARITKRSYRKWKKISKFSKMIFECFSVALAQNNETKKYLSLLGVKKIKLLGNLKFSETKIKIKKTSNQTLKHFFDSKKIWCASSTHNNEELLSIYAHKKLKKNFKNFLTIIIPRHINRVEKIYEDIKSLGLVTHLHSSKNKIKKNTEIYLVDTYGETETFFKLCKTVFLGGSMIKHGGQNPLEPARLGCKILHGPHINNFNEIYSLLDKNKISIKVNNLVHLISQLRIILKKNVSSKKLIYNLKKLGNTILYSSLIEIKKFIKQSEIKKT